MVTTRSLPRGDTEPVATRDRLSDLVADSGLPLGEFSRLVLGRDPRSLRRYLSGEPIPPTLAEYIRALVRIEATPDRVSVVVRR